MLSPPTTTSLVIDSPLTLASSSASCYTSTAPVWAPSSSTSGPATPRLGCDWIGFHQHVSILSTMPPSVCVPVLCTPLVMHCLSHHPVCLPLPEYLSLSLLHPFKWAHHIRHRQWHTYPQSIPLYCKWNFLNYPVWRSIVNWQDGWCYGIPSSPLLTHIPCSRVATGLTTTIHF